MDWNPWQWLGFLSLAALVVLLIVFVASAVVVVVREKAREATQCPRCGHQIAGGKR